MDNWGWLYIATRQEDFYKQIEEFVGSLGLSLTDEMSDLFHYQSDLMLKLDYDPRQGKIGQYAYNFPKYFAGGPLEAEPIRIHFRDTHMGVNRQYPLEKWNPHSFARAAIGESYPFVRIRHYQHQLDAAETIVQPAEEVSLVQSSDRT
jgi:putative methyltransferase